MSAACGPTAFIGHIHNVSLSSTRGSLSAWGAVSRSSLCTATMLSSVIRGRSPTPPRPVVSKSRKTKVLISAITACLFVAVLSGSVCCQIFGHMHALHMSHVCNLQAWDATGAEDCNSYKGTEMPTGIKKILWYCLVTRPFRWLSRKTRSCDHTLMER